MDQMGFLGFFLKRISNRVRPALEPELTEDTFSIKKISLLFPMTHWLGDASKIKRNQTLRKKLGVKTQLTVLEVLVYPAIDKRAHARVVSHSAYHLDCIKITSFLIRDSKR
jgi:anthranilate phosphoribosyltransferase